MTWQEQAVEWHEMKAIDYAQRAAFFNPDHYSHYTNGESYVYAKRWEEIHREMAKEILESSHK